MIGNEVEVRGASGFIGRGVFEQPSLVGMVKVLLTGISGQQITIEGPESLVSGNPSDGWMMILPGRSI